MPLILQAANWGIPVININTTAQYQAMWDRWVQIHLVHCDQNIIISNASNLLGQEVQEFIGSLLAMHDRQSQSWLHLNAAASEEHRSGALSRVDQASVYSSCESMAVHVPQQLPNLVVTT